MDPRFKMEGFAEPSEAIKAKDTVRSLVAGLIAEKERTTASIVTLPVERADNTWNDLSPWNMFDKIVASSTAQGTPVSRAIKEVDMYLSDELLPRKDQSGNLTFPLE